MNMKAYACKSIPQFDNLRAMSEVKAELLRQTGGGDSFLDQAADRVRLHVLQAVPYRTNGAEFLGQMHRQGVADEELARALAKAWLDDADHFYLPAKRWRDRFRSTGPLLLVSFVAALFAVIAIISKLRHVDPDLDSILLSMPPLLAIIGIFLTTVIFKVLKILFHK